MEISPNNDCYPPVTLFLPRFAEQINLKLDAEMPTLEFANKTKNVLLKKPHMYRKARSHGIKAR